MSRPISPLTGQTNRRISARRRRRLLAERLEDRRLLTVFVVTDLRDDTLANLAGDGELSLREAIEAANTDSPVDGSPAGNGADEITFAAGLFGAIPLVNEGLEITDDLTLTGPLVSPSAEFLEVSGEDTVQVLKIEDVDVVIRDLTLGSGSATNGGVIENQGNLTIEHGEVVGGRSSLDGGGVFNAGTLTVINSRIEGNMADRDGGGVYNVGTLVITNTTVGRNRARVSGGGIHNSSLATINSSTIAENRADTNDDAVGEGGGLFTVNSVDATTRLFNVLMVDNDAGFINNSLLSDITGKNVDASSSHNLISDPNSAGGLVEGTNGNLVGDGSGGVLGFGSVFADGRTESRGGNTLIYALTSGSRAIDSGDNTLATTTGADLIPGTGDAGEVALSTDQREQPFDRIFGGTIDIGSYERQTLDASLFVVTTALDEIDYSNAEVSLREAFNSATGSVGDDTITFGGVFADATADTIELIFGQLSTYGNDLLTVEGTGQNLLTIDAMSRSRVINFEGFEGSLALSGMTITGGQTEDNGAGIRFLDGQALTITDSTITGNTIVEDNASGGGIYSDGLLTLTRSVISANSTSGRGGGLVSTEFDYLSTITDSTITGNTAGADGGGADFGYALITGSTITGNSSGVYGGGLYGNYLTVRDSVITGNVAERGGGIYSGEELVLSRSTISGNTASGTGGGLYANYKSQISDSTISGNKANEGGGIKFFGTHSLINSTVTGNTADGDGGGVVNFDGDTRITNSTIVGNRANASADAKVGGGIWTFDDENTRTLLNNSIVAGNRNGAAAADTADDISNKDVETGSTNNVVSDPASSGGLTEGGNGNRVGNGAGVALSLESIVLPLRDNGGPTLTHSPVAGGRAVDGGNNAVATTGGDDGIPGTGDDNETPLTSDQRGAPIPRIVDSDGDGVSTVDIGAVELAIDFGDAPSGFPVASSDDGARHIAIGPRLGPRRDADNDGIVSADSSHDDVTVVDDEDGVLFGGIEVGASVAAVNIHLENAASGRVDAWIDFNRNGTWEAGEKIIDNVEVTNPTQTLNYNLPDGVVAGAASARVRLSSAGNLDPTGIANDGEVEDYQVMIVSAPTVQGVSINHDDDQRSKVDHFAVTFDRLVDIDDDGEPFVFIHEASGEKVAIKERTDTEVDGKTVASFTFEDGTAFQFGSLIDGHYRFTIDSDLVTHFGVPLDGDMSGESGGDYIFGDDQTELFFRIFGDGDGNGVVDINDFGGFRATFGRLRGDAGYNDIYNFNADVSVNLFDFGKFRDNFGT